MISSAAFQEEGFGWATAYAMALSSRLAYRDADQIESVVRERWGFDRFRSLQANERQGFVAARDDTVLVAFRGTDSLSDWISNLTLMPSAQPYGRVHKGFVEAYQDLHDQLLHAFSDFRAGDKKTWLAGHSLGGAMASIAVAELSPHANLAGCYTFGQPRVGNGVFAASVRAALPDGFFRFVNNDDLVTRLPPGYSHPGALVHFNADGSVRQEEAAVEATAAVESESESGALGRQQFAELQADAEAMAKQATLDLQTEEAAIEAADRSLEGLWTGVADHAIDRYVGAVRRQCEVGSVEAHVSSELESEVFRAIGLLNPSGFLYGVEGGTEEVTDDSQASVPILLRVKDSKSQWAPPEGMIIYSQVGAFYTGRATSEQIEALQNDNNVASVSASRQVGFSESTDAVEFVHGDAVQRPPLDERGDMSLVGIIDTGVDVLHEAFYADDPAATGGVGQTRIRVVWNQRDPGGPSPHAVDPGTFPDAAFKLGTLYVENEINQMIAGTRSTPAALRDPKLHGTFVASVAAGRATGTAPNEFQGGMAPEAGLCVVIPDMFSEDGDPNSIGYSVSHIAAIDFMKRYAESEQLPIAVNVSLGMNAGAHDGQSALEGSFDALSTMGRDSGFVIVKSAGNEHSKKGHAALQAANGLCEKISWKSQQDPRRQDYFEVWYDGDDDLEFFLDDPLGNRIGPINNTNPRARCTLAGNDCLLDLDLNHVDNGDNLLAITIRRSPSPIQHGEWVLGVVGQAVRTSGRVDAWVERHNHRPVSFIQGVSEEMTLSIPGTADTVISVASCDLGDPLQLASSSSRGPTRTGGAKPDFAAPGDGVEGARANSSDHRANRHGGGTSYSAPLITGAVALAFSRRHKQMAADGSLRQINARQVRTALKRSAMHRRVLHHTGFGHGVLDAVAFVQEF